MLLANTAQIRRADEVMILEKKLPGILLMEEAGRKFTEAIFRDYPAQESFFIVVGPGNNGGDGLVIGRMLHLYGKEVQFFLSHPAERFTGDALINYQVIAEMPIPLVHFGEEELDSVASSFSTKPLLIDSLLGTGIQTGLREPMSLLIPQLKKLHLETVAVDLPSGLGAHTGEIINDCLEANRTYTFQLPKICHAVMPAAKLCGEIEILDIGIWPEVIEQLEIKREFMDSAWANRHLVLRDTNSHKGNFGHLLLVGGSKDMPGAITMSTYAAMRTGLGLASVFCPEACTQTLLNHCPEAMCKGNMGDHLSPGSLHNWDKALAGKDAVLIGPGMGHTEETETFLKEILPRIQVPLIMDADALNILAANDDMWTLLPDSTIITPHPGEMRRLTGLENIQDRRLEVAERLAQDKGVIVVLKGAGTIVASPDGHTYVNGSGNPGMATAGSGDVLAGMIGSLVAQGYEAGKAAALAVFFHGQAGDRAAGKFGMAGLTAMDISRNIFVDKL
ncbi:MAG: NAD(P)H-hydrate dehydratase [Bacteroidia bacterium]|nr:NAD(P)H-hydrate dehydratase [Bacteroidia bacterium]